MVQSRANRGYTVTQSSPLKQDFTFELSHQDAVQELASNLGAISVTSNAENPVRRRATFSIPSGSAQGRFQSYTWEMDPKHPEPTKRQIVAVVPEEKSVDRRDSAIYLGESDEDLKNSLMLRPGLSRDNSNYSKASVDLRNIDDVQPDELPFLEEDVNALHEVAQNMEHNEVLYYQSSMDQIASVFLPKELKTITNPPKDSKDGERLSIKSDDDIVVCVIGVGYVGEQLLSAFGSVFHSIGFDVSQARLDKIAPDFKHLPKVELTSDVMQLSRGTHYLIAVPTNLHKDHSVNATHLLTAISTVASHARAGSCVVIESSVSVGMTRSFLSQYSDTLHCGMSPERVDPGRTTPTLQQIPKVISALDEESMEKIDRIYSQVFDRVVKVSRPEVAEMTKLYENCYRMINIAYVNEIADACSLQGIDPNEVIDAASTKPFGYQAFRPGLGVGGHCIPVNPYYLLVNNQLPVLEHASQQMWDRPSKLARDLYITHSAKRKVRQSSSGLRVLVVGVAFKPGQSVISCSPGLSFATALSELGCKGLRFYDPLVPQADAPWMKKLPDAKFTRKFVDGHFDLVTVCLRQHGVDFSILDDLRSAKVHYFYN